MLQIGDKKVKTQLDTGAAKSFMSVETYNSMEEKQPLRPTKSVYHSYTQHPIPLVGTVVFPVKWKRKWINVKFNVAEQDQSPLISGAVCHSHFHTQLLLHGVGDTHTAVISSNNYFSHSTGLSFKMAVILLLDSDTFLSL